MNRTRAWFGCVILATLCVIGGGCGVMETVMPVAKRVGGKRYRMQRVFTDRFRDMREWVNLTPGAKWRVEKGTLYGHWAPGGSTLWCKRDFEGDLYVEFEARLTAPDKKWLSEKLPEGGKNINLWFLVTGPAGEDILSVYRKLAQEGTGPNRIGDDQYRGYFFAWTCIHARLRRSPGYEKVSEKLSSRPELDRLYKIAVLKENGRIKYWIDGRLIHDYQDDHPFDHGKIGFALYKSNAEISNLHIYRIFP